MALEAEDRLISEHFTADALQAFKVKKILPDEGNLRRFFDESDDQNPEQIFTPNYQQNLRELLQKNFASDNSIYKSEFKKFYCKLIIAKARQFKQHFLADQDYEEKFSPYINNLFLAYVFSCTPKLEDANSKRKGNDPVYDCIEQMNQQVSKLLIHQHENHNKFFNYLVADNVNEEKKIAMLANHFNTVQKRGFGSWRRMFALSTKFERISNSQEYLPTQQALSKEFVIKALKQELQFWQSIEPKINEVEEEKDKILNQQENINQDVIVSYTNLVSEFLTEQRSKVQDQIAKINQDIVTIKNENFTKTSTLQVSLMINSMTDQSHALKQSLLKGCTVLQRNTQVYQRRINEQKHPIIYSALDAIGDIVRSIKTKITGKTYLAPREIVRLNDASWENHLESKLQIENQDRQMDLNQFINFMQNPQNLENLQQLIARCLEFKNTLPVNVKESLTLQQLWALLPEDDDKNLLRQVLMFVNTLEDCGSRIIADLQEKDSDNFSFPLESFFKNTFGAEQISQFNLEILDSIVELSKLTNQRADPIFATIPYRKEMLDLIAVPIRIQNLLVADDSIDNLQELLNSKINKIVMELDYFNYHSFERTILDNRIQLKPEQKKQWKVIFDAVNFFENMVKDSRQDKELLKEKLREQFADTITQNNLEIFDILIRFIKTPGVHNNECIAALNQITQAMSEIQNDLSQAPSQ